MSADKIIITEDGEEINLTHLEREFGSYQKERNTSPNTLHRDMTKTETPWKSS